MEKADHHCKTSSKRTSSDDNRLTSNEEDTTKRKRTDSSSVVTTGANLDVKTDGKIAAMQFNIDGLPTEMLEAILSNLATVDLLNCRQVNRKWIEISSRIMRTRADIQITFALQREQLMLTAIQYFDYRQLEAYVRPIPITGSSLSLSDLVECVKQSEHFPYTSFRLIDDLRYFQLNHDLELFWLNWGHNIFVLNVTMSCTASCANVLTVLLRAKTPNLRKLVIDFGFQWISATHITTDSIHLAAMGANKLKMPQLNVLRVEGSFGDFCGVVTDILKAAPNLNFFEKCSLHKNTGYTESITARDLIILQSLNKVHCLKNVTLMLNEELIAFLEKSPHIVDAKFKSIELPSNWVPEERLNLRATRVINKIFDSSRKSLKKLRIPSLGLFHTLIIPRFENLQKLYLSHKEGADDHSMFPPLFDMVDSFPNLEELTVCLLGEDGYFSTYEPTNVFPKVKILRIVDDDRYDEKLMKMTPNLKTLLIVGHVNFDLISIHLKRLTTLNWKIEANNQHQQLAKCNLDSIITGFPRKFCRQMSAVFRDKVRLSTQEVAEYERHRVYYSVMNCPGLRRFNIKFILDNDSYKRYDCSECDAPDDCSCTDEESSDMAGFDRDSMLYRSCLTKVSQFLAFDLMPKLRTDVSFEFID